MCRVTNITGALHLAFLGTKHFVHKLGPKVYATYYTLNVKINFRLKQPKDTKHLQQLRSETLQRSPAQQSFDFPGIPPDQGVSTAAELAAAGCRSSCEDSMGHAGVLQHALRRAAQPASPAHLLI